MRRAVLMVATVAAGTVVGGCGSGSHAPRDGARGEAATAATAPGHSAVARRKPARANDGRRYPAAVYPPARSFPDWGFPSGCPSLRNVRRLGPGASKGALRAVRRLNGSPSHDRRWADRAYWPALGPGHRDLDASRAGHHRGGPARASDHAALLRNNCGRAIVRRSWWIATAPGDPRTHPGLARNYVLLQRRHRWLLWFTTP